MLIARIRIIERAYCRMPSIGRLKRITVNHKIIRMSPVAQHRRKCSRGCRRGLYARFQCQIFYLRSNAGVKPAPTYASTFKIHLLVATGRTLWSAATRRGWRQRAAFGKDFHILESLCELLRPSRFICFARGIVSQHRVVKDQRINKL